MKESKITPNFTAFDKTIEVITIALLLTYWATLLLTYPSLPEKIPIHFNYKGEIDNVASKGSIILLPIISTLVYALLSVLAKYPENFNYTEVITAENAQRNYTQATRILRFTKLGVIVLFMIIDYYTIEIALDQKQKLDIWPILAT